MDIQEAKSLLARYQAGTCTADEKQLVDRWYQELEHTSDLELTGDQKAALNARMAAWLEARTTEEAPVIKINQGRSRRNMWWAAAATLLLMVSAASVWYLQQEGPAADQPIAMVNPETIAAPDAVRATLTLADGTVIALDSVNSATMAGQAGVKMVRLPSGELVYDTDQDLADGPEQWNTLSNPRGSRVATLVLSDGSRVWLNAGSSITYPVAFSRRQRNVSIAGEAYFEVSRDANRPFTVATGETRVSVLGTHFNINAYGDDAEAKVTLLEGSVSVSARQQDALLKPGQQAVVASGIEVTNDVDTEEVMAWKNGIFHFESASIEQVMLEIGRWYDMEIKFSGGKSSRRFGGEISRNSTLGQVLTILEESKVKFSVQGKTITVTAEQ